MAPAVYFASIALSVGSATARLADSSWKGFSQYSGMRLGLVLSTMQLSL